jgi:hypothetical protein
MGPHLVWTFISCQHVRGDEVSTLRSMPLCHAGDRAPGDYNDGLL